MVTYKRSVDGVAPYTPNIYGLDTLATSDETWYDTMDETFQLGIDDNGLISAYCLDSFRATGDKKDNVDLISWDDALLYVDKSGNKYYEENGKLIQTTGEKADDGTWVKSANAKEVSFDADKKAKAKQTVYNQGAELSDVVTGTKAYTSLAESAQKKMSLSDDEMSTYLSTLTTNIGTVNSYENGTDTLGDDSNYTREKVIANIQSAYRTGGSTAVTAEVNKYAQIISDNKTAMTDSQKIMDDNQVLADIAAMEDGDEKTKAIESFVSQVKTVQDITTNPSVEYNIDAKKIDGCDSKITLNGIEYIGSSNSFSINGLNITAQVVTGDGDANAISITTATDTQGIYDKIKDFLSQYNSLINEITSLYNADSAKGYEPLTDDEKDAMSDTEVEKWEQKIKDSLLRRDDNLESLMSAMTSAMSGAVEVNGKKMYLSNFGIKTLGYLNAPANQQNAYHIDGDEDDANSSGNADKLMTAITNDPDTVINFMQGLADNLYKSVHTKMQSSPLSSIYTVYNDKEMASEYSDYTDLIKKWEEKLQDKEDYYYKKFSSMETALSKLNSQTSSLSGLFGG